MSDAVYSVRGHVEGIPLPWRRRFTRSGHVYNTSDSAAWMDRITLTLRQQCLPETHDGSWSAALLFLFPRPKAHYRTGRYSTLLRDVAPMEHLAKPDVDNLTKSVLDALNGVLWHDDAQVVSIGASKAWASRDQDAGVSYHFTQAVSCTLAAARQPELVK